MEKKGLIGAISLGVIMIFAVIIISMVTVRVPAGYVAVQYKMNGGVKDEVLTQGWHLVSPTTHTTLYTIGIEQSYLTKGDKGDSKKNERFSASSIEGKAIDIDLTFTYQYKQDKVSEVFTKFKGKSGEEVKDSFIKPNIISWTKEIVAKEKVTDILGEKRASINNELTKYLADKFEEYNILITNVSLINIEVDANTQKAINDKIAAQQKAETQKINNQTAIEKAEADATVKKTEAQAKADAKLITAKAEAKANELIQKSLSMKVLYEQWISKWSGNLPTYMSGDSNGVMIDLSGIEN